MKMNCKFKLSLATALLGAWSVMAAPDNAGFINIVKTNSYVVPVSITGFDGEAASVLKFDLEVLGMGVTSPDKADFLVSGSQSGQVKGSLTPKGADRPFWARAYAGGSVRAQAHAFANDIVKEIRGTEPIFLTRIAFRQQQGRSTEIALSDFDGYNATVLTRDGTLVSGPSWIPGGRGLLYVSWKNGGEQILEHNLSTGERRVFAGFPGANLSPAVSPDGQKVAMILSRDGNPNLWVCNMDRSGLHKLSSTEDSGPTWSPDSGEICFVRRSGHASLQKVSAGGGAARPLRVAGVYGNVTSPDWSPDGKWIAFTSGSGNFVIWVAPAGGGDAQKLVEGEDPCWAPNSRTLVFSRRVSNKRTLCLLDVPTKRVKNVMQLSGSCSEPSWAR
jgi:TolB protein